MSDKPLHMLQFEMYPEQLVAYARRLRITASNSPWPEDNGYLVHGVLGETFGDEGPSPFAIKDEGGRRIQVLAYAVQSAEELQLRAQRFADPRSYNAIHWPDFVSKPMPTHWPAGGTYRFVVRAHPVVRLARKDTPVKVGAEVDAFLARCWQEPDDVPVSREEVYRQWLTDWFARREACAVDDVQVTRFQVTRLIRRTHGQRRIVRRVEGPDVTFSGLLRVTHPEGFVEILRRGVGRHRAFGFGMLLLKPG